MELFCRASCDTCLGLQLCRIITGWHGPMRGRVDGVRQSDDRIAVGNHTNPNKSEVCLYFLSVFNIWILDQRGFVVRRQIVACDRSCESDLDFPKWTAINAVVIRIKWQFTQSPSITTNLMISYWSEAVSLKTKWSTKPSWSPKHKTIAKKNVLHWGESPYLGDMQDMQVPVLGYSAS